MTSTQRESATFPNGRLILIGGLFVFLSAFIGRQYAAWIKNSDSFLIRNVVITGNELISKKDVTQLIGFDSTKTVWDIDLPASEKRITDNTFTEKICITRRFPNELHVQIHEKTPVALLNFKGTLYCMNSERLILPSKPGKMYDLPVLSGPFEGSVNVGQEVTGELVEDGIRLLRMMIEVNPALYSNISEVVVGREQGMVIYTSKAVPIWFGESIVRQKVRNLEAILNQLKTSNEMKAVRYIDLRFRGQVVVGMRV